MINIRQITTDLRLAILDLDTFSLSMNIEAKRDQEKAGARFLLEKLLETTDFDIIYNEHKKPFIAGANAHISISHSHNKLVVVLNTNENTGVDIELIRAKVLKIKHKFVNDQEALLAKDDVEKLITVWAAKEALYKCYGLKSLDFKTNLFVEDFEKETFFGKIETIGFKKRLLLKKEKINDYMLVYILKDQAD